MADMLSPHERSTLNARIKSSGTRPEAKLYEIVRAILGNRRGVVRSDRDLPGTPNLVVPSLHLVILANGCFCHCCPKYGRVPDSNRACWEPKLTDDVRPDRAHGRALRALGFSVWRFCEHDLGHRSLARTYTVL